MADLSPIIIIRRILEEIVVVAPNVAVIDVWSFFVTSITIFNDLYLLDSVT